MNNRQTIEAHIHVHPEVVDQTIRVMDRHGIEVALDLSPSHGSELKDRIKAYRRYPGRFYAACGINFAGFGSPGWLAREKEALQRHLELGAVAIKIWKDLGLHLRDIHGDLIRVDDDLLGELLDYAQELGFPVVFHVADPKAFFLPLTRSNERWEELKRHPDWWFGDRSRFPYDWWQIIRQLERVIVRHRKAPIVGAHFGCAAEEVGYVADLMRENPHYLVDTSARLAEIGRHPADYVQEVFTEFQDQILFGSDLVLTAKNFPSDREFDRIYSNHWEYFETNRQQIEHPSPVQGAWKIDAINLPQQVREKIYYDNAKRCFLAKHLPEDTLR